MSATFAKLRLTRTKKTGSNKLLQDVLAQTVGPDTAREVFAEIAGAYDRRLGDAHPTGSKVADAIKLAGIDQNLSYLRAGRAVAQQLWKSNLVRRELYVQPVERSQRQ